MVGPKNIIVIMISKGIIQLEFPIWGNNNLILLLYRKGLNLFTNAIHIINFEIDKVINMQARP